MAKTTPIVRDGRLTFPEEGQALSVVLESAEWWRWLDSDGTAFRYEAGSGTFTARRERKTGGAYWYAYRRSGGRLAKVYLGKSGALTAERLDAGLHALHRRGLQGGLAHGPLLDAPQRPGFAEVADTDVRAYIHPEGAGSDASRSHTSTARRAGPGGRDATPCCSRSSCRRPPGRDWFSECTCTSDWMPTGQRD